MLLKRLMCASRIVLVFLIVFQFLASHGVCSSGSIEELQKNNQKAKDAISSGSVEYQRRVWRSENPWNRSHQEIRMVGGIIDDATLPPPVYEDHNIIVFRKDGDTISWKLTRRNTRNLAGETVEDITRQAMDYIGIYSVKDGVVRSHFNRRGDERHYYTIRKFDKKEDPADYGQYEKVWEYGLSKLFDDKPNIDYVRDEAVFSGRQDGMVEVTRRYSDSEGINVREVFNPIQQGRCMLIEVFDPLLPGHERTGRSCEIFYEDFNVFDGILFPTRKVYKDYRSDVSLLESGDFVSPSGEYSSIFRIDDIVVLNATFNIPISDHDLEVEREPGDYTD